MVNSDQTPSKHVQVGSFNLAPKGAKKVRVTGIIVKWSPLHWLLLWMQKFYYFKQFIEEKQSRLYQKIIFPQFLVWAQTSSDTQDVLKHL